MRLCNWPEGCTRPVRANGKCASHNVMWQRAHPSERKVPKRRGTKRRRMAKAEWAKVVRRSHALNLAQMLVTQSRSLTTLIRDSGLSYTTVKATLRAMEASGLKIQRTHNPENAREVLRHVTPDEAARWLEAMKEMRP